MKRKFIIIIIPVIAVVSAFMLALLLIVPNLSAPTAGNTQLVQQYVSQHISELSPQKAVLGGTFQVTSIQVATSSGIVNYEDGHIALTADFTYTVQNSSVDITSFTVRQ